MNKFKKISTPQGDVLVDESAEIKEGDKIGRNKKPFIVTAQKGWNNTLDLGYKVIIATINHSINLDVPMVIVEDEVEKLAKLHAEKVWGVYENDIHPDVHITDTLGEISQKDFIAGASQQKGTHSDKAMLFAYIQGCNDGALHERMIIDENYEEAESFSKESTNRFMQSLKQEYIELEMEAECCKKYTSCNTNCRYDNETVWKIKTDRVDGQLIAYIKK
jgi:hypothetical protein